MDKLSEMSTSSFCVLYVECWATEDEQCTDCRVFAKVKKISDLLSKLSIMKVLKAELRIQQQSHLNVLKKVVKKINMPISH